MEAECVTRRWGNSLGIIIPRKITDQENIKENEKVLISVRKGHNAQEFFGLFSDWKRPTAEIKEEMKRGW